jgi:YbgC/YbaW family acyl-CoA thioester hydrolase
VHLIFRTILVVLGRAGRPLPADGVSSTTFRVLPTDLDVMGHMNNGMYFSIMDLGRTDLLRRIGAWKKMVSTGILPVIANETITFRKSLRSWMRFTIETRIIGFDEKAMYFEQRVVVDREIYARATMRARFTKRTGGTATIAEWADATGIDVSRRLSEEWIDRWSRDVALPPTKAPAPSDWA